MEQHGSPQQCPKCGSPRDPQARDCPFCGIVFARYDPSRHQPPVAPPPLPVQADLQLPGPEPPPVPAEAPAMAPPVVRQPAALRRPLTAHDRFLESVKGNLGALVLVALLVHLGVAALFASYILGGSDDPMRVRDIHRMALGRPVPEGFDNGVALWFVGRHLVFLVNQGDGLLYLLYYEGALAGTTPPEEARQQALALLDELEIPWQRTGESHGMVSGQPVAIDRLQIQIRGTVTASAFLSVFSTPQGRTVGLFFMGPEKPATNLAKEMLSRGF